LRVAFPQRHIVMRRAMAVVLHGRVGRVTTSPSSRLSFQHLVERLPRLAEQPRLEVPQGPALSVTPERTAGYVEPSFVAVDWPADAAVLLVEAAGAVGKSAAAEALAESLRSPLVRAERAQVGSYTLSGLVQDALGFSSNFVPAVAVGDAVLVVDSMDEAHLKAGTQNFFSFLENLQSISGSGRASGARKPSLVVFSRSDTAELIRLFFADRELPLAHARLDFFNKDGACSFIKSYMELRFRETGRPEYNVHLASPRPFEKLRDARLRQLATSVTRAPIHDLREAWEGAADFLGYAPVLVALAESLAVPNPAREHMQVSETADPTDLLASIIDLIMAREQTKVAQLAEQLRARSSPAESDLQVESLFTQAEQVLRVTALVTDRDLLISPPTALPASIREDYEQRAVQWTADHPFVRNRKFASVVFQDYVLAHCALSLAASASFEQRIETWPARVGPFFASFAHREFTENQVPAVRESLLEWLMESWLEDGQLTGDRSSVAFLELREESGRLSLWRNVDAVDAQPPLEFAVNDLSGALHLRGSCANATVVSQTGVLLGDRARTLLLGPNLTVSAPEIAIEAEALAIEARRDASGVRLAAKTLTANYLTQVSCANVEELRIYTRDCAPRLRPFVADLTAHGVSIEYHEYVNLRALLLAFGRSVQGGPAVFGEKLEQAVIKDNQHRQLLRDRLLERGVISREGPLYRLDLRALSELRFGLADIKSGDPSQAVLAFLAEVKRHVD
jgi:hypothetical protein